MKKSTFAPVCQWKGGRERAGGGVGSGQDTVRMVRGVTCLVEGERGGCAL